MIKFINRATKTPMWVADERKNEYLEAGHELASSCVKKPVEETEVEDVKPVKEVKKKTSKKK